MILTLLLRYSSINPIRGPPKIVSTLTLIVFRSQPSQWGLSQYKKGELSHHEIMVTQPQSSASTPPLLWHLGLGWMFQISELWALKSTGQMCHDSSWISSQIIPKQPKRRNLFSFFFLFCCFFVCLIVFLSGVSFTSVSLFLIGFPIIKVFNSTVYKPRLKTFQLF